jgi:hypothetical protein
MGDVTRGEQVARTLEALSPAAEARAARRLNLILLLIPLPEMTQEEADWLFWARVRLAGEE